MDKNVLSIRKIRNRTQQSTIVKIPPSFNNLM